MLSTPNISFTVASRPKQNPHQPMALLHIPERGSEEVHIYGLIFIIIWHQSGSTLRKLWSENNAADMLIALITSVQFWLVDFLGCNTAPPTPQNAGLHCSQYSGCRATCVPRYQFPNGATQLFINCNNGHWVIEGQIWQYVPSCQRNFLSTSLDFFLIIFYSSYLFASLSKSWHLHSTGSMPVSRKLLRTYLPVRK